MGKGFKYSAGCEATSAFGVEVQTKVREDFTITEKAHTWAFSWLKDFTMLNEHLNTVSRHEIVMPVQ